MAYALLFITLILCVSYVLPVKFLLLDVLNKRKSKKCIWNFLAALTVCLVLFGFTGLMKSLSFTITLITVTLYPVVRLWITKGIVYFSCGYLHQRKKERRWNYVARQYSSRTTDHVLSAFYRSRALHNIEVIITLLKSLNFLKFQNQVKFKN